MLSGTADQCWIGLCEQVLSTGQTVMARGKHTVELIGVGANIDMLNPIMTIKERQLGYSFLLAEAAWILNGRNDVKGMAPYSKAITNFSDDGHFFFGAYGPKIVQQLPHVLKALGHDPFSRQAVLNIWRESPPESKDLPCSLSVQWLYRGNQLHCVYTMRSSDVWLGAPYDWFNFSMLSAYVLLLLRNMFPAGVWGNAQLGFLHYRAGSCHLYETEEPLVAKILSESATPRTYRTLNINEFREPRHLLQHLERLADMPMGAIYQHDFGLETLQWRAQQRTDRTK